MRRHLYHLHAGRRCMQRCRYDDIRTVRDGDEVYTVGTEIREAVQLNTTLQHTQEEIICGTDTLARIPGDVARTDDGAAEAALAGFAKEVFGDVFGLAVAGCKARAADGEGVGF